MKKFLLIYHSQPMTAMAPTPDQVKAMMDAWMVWTTKCGAGMVDLGNPLAPHAHRITGQGAMDITSSESGYTMIQADDMTAAVKMLDGHPMMHQPGSSIVVHEVTPMPGM